MDVETTPIQSIYHFHDPPRRRSQRRKNRAHKGKDQGSKEPASSEEEGADHLDLIA